MPRYDRGADAERESAAYPTSTQKQYQQEQQQQQQPRTDPHTSTLRRTSLFFPSLVASSIMTKDRALSIASDTSSSSSSSSRPLLSSFRSNGTDGDIEAFGHQSKNQRSARKGPRFRRKSRSFTTRAHLAQIRLLRLIWMVILILGEHGAYWVMLRRCSWPENSTWDMSDGAMQERYRIAIVADPQLTDWYSYKQLGLSLWLTEFFTDIFMRRSFGRLHREFSPDAVLFLGDLMDGGRETFEQAVYDKNRARFLETVFDSRRTAWNLRPIVEDVATVEETNGIEPGTKDVDEPWRTNIKKREGRQGGRGNQQQHSSESALSDSQAQPQAVGDLDNAEELSIAGHFQQIIDIPSNAVEREAIRSSGKSVRLYVAGNHDTGFGDTMIRKAVRRYKQDFGSINYEITVGNHSLVVLDTLALSANITSITLESEEFLTRMGQEPPTLPRILFTHVPLFRLDSTPCGNARESKQLILDRNGEQYQNLVNATLSRRILRQIQPDMVFSGDDHDWCEIAHSLDSDRLTPEVTVRTFSFAQGIRRPAFVMLSLYNPQMKQRNDATMLQTAVPAAEPSKSLLQADPSALTGAAAGLESGFQHMSRVAMVSQKSTFAYEECMLPDQLAIYIGYAALFGVSLVWLLILRWRTFSQSHHHSDPLLVRWRQQLQYASHSKPRHAPTKATNSTTLHPFDVEETNESRGSTTGMQLSPSMTSSQEKFMTLSDDLLSDRENEQEEAVGGDEKEDERLSLSFNRQGKTLSSLSPITTGKGFHGQGWQGGRGVDMWAWMRYRVEQAWWQWPVRSPAFWQLLGLDHLDIARLVVPFYVFLLLISLL